eukprot:1457331-Rhodomonas_salina.1
MAARFKAWVTTTQQVTCPVLNWSCVPVLDWSRVPAIRLRRTESAVDHGQNLKSQVTDALSSASAAASTVRYSAA